MSVAELVVASVVMAVGATLQGAVGFGGNLVAAPLFVLIDPSLVPGPALVAAFALNLLMVGRDRSAGQVSEVGWALLGRLPGTAIGAAAVALIPQRRLQLFFAVMILVVVGLSVSRLRLRPTVPSLLGAGAASGFTATSVAVGGPPIALVYQHASGPVLRATLARFFAIGVLLSMVALAVAGQFDRDDALAGLALVPATVAGFAVSGRLTRFLDRGLTRLAVLSVSGASAVAVLLRAAL